MAMNLEELTQCVFAILRDDLLTVGEEFTTDSDLVEAGLDSLALTQLMLSIEEATGVWVDEGLLTEEAFASTHALAAVVHEQLG